MKVVSKIFRHDLRSTIGLEIGLLTKITFWSLHYRARNWTFDENHFLVSS